MAKPRILEDIDQLYNKIAEIIDEILPNQLMQKSVYDADDDGVVDNAKHAKNLKKSDGTTVDADTIATKLLKIPTYNGNTNQVLTSNGDGTASWKDAQGGDIGYDNAESGLTSTNVQGAIDEVNSHMKTGINDVKAQLTSGEHEFRFGVTADGEFGYHKEVEGADTVVPFKNTIGFNMFSLHSMANNSYYSVLPASLFKNYKLAFPSRYGDGKLLIYGLKGEYDFSKVQSAPQIPLDKTLLYQIEMSDIKTEYELPEEVYDYFAFWSDWTPSLGKLGVEFNFIPK